MLAASEFFRNSNYLEAILWLAISSGFFIALLCRKGERHWKLAIAGVTLAAFGISDIVEVETGAWWRPWWLLAWKGACVLVMLLLYIDYIKNRRRSRRPSRSD